jgi:hypothetical protein
MVAVMLLNRRMPMIQRNISRILKSDYLYLLPIIALAFYVAFIPHLSYPYPVHLDEWLHLANSQEIVTEATTNGLTDPFTGGAISGNQLFETGFYLFWAIFHQISGISWLDIFRYFPSIIFVFTILAAYILGRRQGFGLEAALFTCLIPTTVGILGPAFLVPVAMGLFFVLLTTFLAFNLRTIWSYLVILFFTGFMVSMHPPTAICLVIILIPFILINLKGNIRHSIGISLALAIPFLAPFPWIFSRLLPTAGSLFTPQLVPGHIDIPMLIPTYGYIPLILCLLGIFWLAIKGGKKEYGLILGLLALLVMLAIFYTLHYGQLFVYERGLMIAMLVMSIIAGAGLAWVKNLKVPAGIGVRLKMPLFMRNVGYFLCVILVGLTLYIAIPARQNIPYYHMINDDDYQAFVWIKDNIDEGYQKAVLEPIKGVAFTAITGKYAYARTYGTPTPNSGQATKFLEEGCADTAFLRENGITIIYTTGECNNPDLREVRDDIYILEEPKPSE